MNLITDTLQGLVRRKLWPVALLLVGALVAVPLVVAKTPEPPATAANLNSHAAKDDAMPATFVSADDATEETTRRRVLGQAKDPFEPKALPKVKKSKKKAKADATATPTATPASPSAPSGGGGGGATAPTSPGP